MEIAMKTRQGLAAVCTALLFLASGCGKAVEDNSRHLVGEDPPTEPSAEVLASVGADPDKMELIASDNKLALYFNLITSEFYIEDRISKMRWYSNPEKWNTDGGASGSNLEMLGSQVVVDYYSDKNESGTMSSYKDAFQKGQITAEKIDGGVRVTYQLGVASTKHNYPEIIRADILDDLLKNIDASVAKILKGRYRLVTVKELPSSQRSTYLNKYTKLEDFDKVYILRDNLSKKALKELEQQFRNAGYSYDDVEEEEARFGINRTDTQTPAFRIPVEYTLSDGDFLATVLTEQIQYTKGYHLTSLRLLPYFGAAGKEEQGYLFVPDGSGALIQLNRNTGDGVLYSGSIYGEDLARKKSSGTASRRQIYMPVFGVNTASSSVLGIVEQGAAGSSIYAYTSGVYTGYNNIYACFAPQIADALSYAEDTSAADTLVFQRVSSTQRFAVRYRFHSGEGDYVTMAKLYRKYLIDTGAITDTTSAGNSFYLELTGGIDKKVNVMGIPFSATEPLTTFEQAEKILTELQQNGVDRISLRYVGWANGGLNNTLFRKANPLSVLGGTSGFKALAEYTKENGIGFYPDAELTYVYKNNMFDGFSPSKQAARFVNRQVVSQSKRLISTGTVTDDAVTTGYLLSISQFDSVLQSFLKSYQKYGVSGLSLKSIGSCISGDYNEAAPIDRAQAMNMLKDSMEKRLSGQYDLLTDGCNAELLPYTKQVTDMPTSSSGLAVTHCSVPFYQIAVSGSVRYTTEAVNMTSDYQKNILKAYEHGASLYCRWMYADSDRLLDVNRTDLYALSYHTWFDDTVALYREYQSRMGEIAGQQIIEHQYITQSFTRTVFANGKQVLVNYGSEPAVYHQVTVPAMSAEII